MTALRIPDLCLIALVGVSGSGKSTFAARHFRSTEVLSSDFCRGLVADDENDQSATAAAFDVLHHIAGKRLEAGRLTVVDATNVQADSRRSLVELARSHHVLAVAVVLDVPQPVCLARNVARPDRNFGAHVLRNQAEQLRRSLRGLRREGFHRVFHLEGEAEISSATFERQPVWNDRRGDHGPFDIVGDVHGCHVELVELLTALGYSVDEDGQGGRHPGGRRALFLGDLVDRGPDTPAVLRLVMGMVGQGTAICLPGNHEVKLLRALRGREVTTSHGLAETLEQLSREAPEFSQQVAKFIDALIAHLVLDEGRLVVAHAGLPAHMHGRASAAVRSFALYGDTSGEIDEFGLPVRYPWAEEYRGEALVVYGHTPVPDPLWVNRTVCIDTGCVFGGRLSALRYPERELVSVPARGVHYQPARPQSAAVDAPRQPSELDLGDVVGKRIIQTRLGGAVTVREENAAAALEVMSRFAVDPRLLVYLPPTMSPTATSERPGLLEHPEEAFAAHRTAGVQSLICEEKHMGSRAVVVVWRDPSVGPRRFGIEPRSPGAVFTRTGRPFFADPGLEAEFLNRVRGALDRSELWDELATDWLILDCELLPWSAKAEALVREQYAAVGAAGGTALGAEVSAATAASARGVDMADLPASLLERSEMVAGFVSAVGNFCWPVRSLDDLCLAPFQILAGEGQVHALRNHLWHLEVLDRLCAADPDTLRSTRALAVEVNDADSCAAGVSWWEELTASGGEGMVVKPVEVYHRGSRGPAQPGIKVRGREYLRIIYGPEYTAERNISRLRARALGHKRSLALREFALGIEALERFVAAEPLYRVHECVFGVLALESEPVDPRL